MKCVELNKKGNFDRWDQDLLTELRDIKVNDDISDEGLIYQDDGLKVSVIGLESYERYPFRIFSNDFNLICLTGGVALSRSSNGQISLLIFEKGENLPFHVNNTTMINDLQNIGESPLVFGLIEFSLNKETDHYFANIIQQIMLAS
ncbi:hypothetical protein ACT6NV_13020 [Robiginitalea sp. IMCC44478]|uniref:hypothetical protein n=1 Tax=Robiginitalea sp. IMCC44478 TaxID=3459122 RepID=UPI0040414A5D